MAFPVISDVINSTQFTPSTSHVVTLPAGVGTLMLIEFCHGNNAPDGHPATFQRLFGSPASFGSGNVNINVWVSLPRPPLLPFLHVERGNRFISAGGTLTLTTPLARRSDIYACLIGANELTSAYFVSAISNGGATAVDPPNLAYSGSAKDVLWIVVGTGIGWTVTGWPTNFNLHQNLHTPADWGHAQGSAWAARELNAASENPGTFPASAGPTSDWHAATFGVAFGGP